MNTINCVELARFQVSPSDDAQMRAQAEDFFAVISRHFPGLCQAFRLHEGPGKWLDLALWQTQAQAKDAAQRCLEIAELAPYFAPITQVVSMQHATPIFNELLQVPVENQECWEFVDYRYKPEALAAAQSTTPEFFACAKQRLPGFRAAMRLQLEDCHHLDIVRWIDKAAAESAAQLCMQDQKLGAYFAAIEDVGEMIHARIGKP